METNNLDLLNRFNHWLKESVTVKLAVISVLILFLMIPSVWVQSIMTERQQRATEVMTDVSKKWSGQQRISGPILMIPHLKEVKSKNGSTFYKRFTFILPETLNMKTSIQPEVLKRGIFDAVVYHSQVSYKGKFTKPDLESLGITPSTVVWKEIALLNGFSDLRGLGENPHLVVNGAALTAQPSSLIEFHKMLPDQQYIYASLPMSENKINEINFELTASLKGSEHLYFLPLGKSTHVELSGNWKAPSFTGNFLPESRTLSETDFKAVWNVLDFNRPFPQSWTNEMPLNVESSAFGVDLLLPIDQYQKSMRTSKYSFLIILLTFISLFMIELIAKVKIHPFQYILIGASLSVYYILLLSISEHLGFDIAYLIASFGTIVLNSFYSFAYLRKTKVVLLFTGLLSLFYTYIYVITLQEEYALLLGSTGLFLIIAVLMYASKNIKWYGSTEEE